MNIAIIGAGKMGHAIGTRMVAAQHELTIYDRTKEKAQTLAEQLGTRVQAAPLSQGISGDVIIVALPYAATREVVGAHAAELAGKIVVDISNPVDFQTFELIPPPGSSGAEEIAKLLPQGTSIIKAFNSNFAQAIIDGTVNGSKTTVQIAGDDTKAKQTLMHIVEASGLAAADVGPLSAARTLEKTALENIKKMFSQ
jgi:8-hydroxy-5-deazaflavin:NADPH oxidoreductase